MLRKILLIIDSIFIVLAVVVGIDYTCYIANVKFVSNTSTVILSDIINLNIEDKEIIFENKNVEEEQNINFKVENLSDQKTNFNILLKNINNEYENDLVYELFEKEKIVVSKTIAPKTSDNSYIKLNVELLPAEAKEYTLKLKLQNNLGKDINEFANKKFNAILNIDSLSINSTIKTSLNYLLANTNVTEDENAEGLHITNLTNDSLNEYYYKGLNVSNYVSLNNELWRIVKINSDGTIKIIKDNNISEKYQFNTDSRLENGNIFNNSTIKNDLNNFYENNLKQYENILTTSSYCTEIHAVKNDHYKTSDSNINYNEYNASYKCQNKEILKIGLIGIDEAYMAGLMYSNNSSNYLTNGINKNTWTISPAGTLDYSKENYVWKINDFGGVVETTTSNTMTSIRPVITLKSTLNATGNGTIDNPYVFNSEI